MPILGAEACGEDGDGDGGGDEPSTSTCSKMAYSTGEARDATFHFFLALVIIGEMTGLLREGSTCASAGPSPEVVALLEAAVQAATTAVDADAAVLAAVAGPAAARTAAAHTSASTALVVAVGDHAAADVVAAAGQLSKVFFHF